MLGPGTVIGKYVILSPISAGQRSMIYRARDLVAQQEVALKLFADPVPNAAALQAQLQPHYVNEQVAHPNVVVGRELVTDGQVLGVSSALVDGVSLQHFLDNERPGPWRPMEALNLIKTVMETLIVIHEAGKVHQNLKPSNILLDRSAGASWPGRPRLADLGVAQVLNHTPNATRWPGAPPYMSPEQFHQRTHHGPATDVYAMGMILWRMVAGRLPVDVTDLIALRNLYSGRMAVPPLQQLSPAVPSVISQSVYRALLLHPQQRFQTITEFWMALIGQGRTGFESTAQTSGQQPAYPSQSGVSGNYAAAGGQSPAIGSVAPRSGSYASVSNPSNSGIPTESAYQSNSVYQSNSPYQSNAAYQQDSGFGGDGLVQGPLYTQSQMGSQPGSSRSASNSGFQPHSRGAREDTATPTQGRLQSGGARTP